jgi:hypothetical protein
MHLTHTETDAPCTTPHHHTRRLMRPPPPSPLPSHVGARGGRQRHAARRAGRAGLPPAAAAVALAGAALRNGAARGRAGGDGGAAHQAPSGARPSLGLPSAMVQLAAVQEEMAALLTKRLQVRGPRWGCPPQWCSSRPCRRRWRRCSPSAFRCVRGAHVRRERYSSPKGHFCRPGTNRCDP